MQLLALDPAYAHSMTKHQVPITAAAAAAAAKVAQKLGLPLRLHEKGMGLEAAEKKCHNVRHLELSKINCCLLVGAGVGADHPGSRGELCEWLTRRLS